MTATELAVDRIVRAKECGGDPLATQTALVPGGCPVRHPSSFHFPGATTKMPFP